MGTPSRLAPHLLLVSLAAACGDPPAPPTDPPPALAATPKAPEKVVLRLRLEKGKTYFQDMEMVQTISQTVGGKETTTEQTMAVGSSFAVEEVDAAGAMKCRMTWERTRMLMKSPMMNVDYDSRNPPEVVPLPAKGVASLVGKSFELEFRADGTVGKVAGLDRAFDEMLGAVDLPEGPVKESFRENLRNQFGDEAIRDMLEKSMRIYPKDPVGPGDAWKVRIDLRKPMTLNMEADYRLVERRGGVAVLDVDSRVTTPDDAEPLLMGPMKVRFRISGTQKGRMEVEESSGWPLSAAMDQVLEGTIESAAAGPGDQGGMPPVPMKMRGTISISGRRE